MRKEPQLSKAFIFVIAQRFEMLSFFQMEFCGWGNVGLRYFQKGVCSLRSCNSNGTTNGKDPGGWQVLVT